MNQEVATQSKRLCDSLYKRRDEYDKLRSIGQAPLNPVCFPLGRYITDNRIEGNNKHYGNVDTGVENTSFQLKDPSNIYFYLLPPETTQGDPATDHPAYPVKRSTTIHMRPLSETSGGGAKIFI